jgi:hypothetical protein
VEQQHQRSLALLEVRQLLAIRRDDLDARLRHVHAIATAAGQDSKRDQRRGKREFATAAKASREHQGTR